jgi:competence protein ComEA
MTQRVGLFLGGVLAGLLAAGVVLLVASPPRGHAITLQPPPTPAPLRIHVAGAVVEPGVYTLDCRAVVHDAIRAAGGARPQAALDQVNLATPLQDGQQIYVPARDESIGRDRTTPTSPVTGSDLIHVNSATAPEPEALPGIGPALAQAILEYRDSHGPFRSFDALLNVPGIGPAKLEVMRPWISLE